MQTKDQRVLQVAQDILGIARRLESPYERLDALAVATALSRPTTEADSLSEQYPSTDSLSLSAAQ